MYRITALCAVALVALCANAIPALAQVEAPELDPQRLCVEGSAGLDGGTFIDLGAAGYACVLVDADAPGVPPLPPGNTEAEALCERDGGTFVDLRQLGYVCLLPGGTDLPRVPGLPLSLPLG